MYGQGPYGPNDPRYHQQHYYPPQPPPVVYVQQPMIVKAPFNHTVHLILDIVTCGTWLPIHLICWALH